MNGMNPHEKKVACGELDPPESMVDSMEISGSENGTSVPNVFQAIFRWDIP